MRIVVDTGVFSAALSRRRRALHEPAVARLGGHQLFLASQTVAELRYGALVAEWGESRRTRLEAAIAATTVVPVSDALVSGMADLRHKCRKIGHPLAGRAHTGDLWIAATAVHLQAPLITEDRIFDGTPGLSLG